MQNKIVDSIISLHSAMNSQLVKEYGINDPEELYPLPKRTENCECKSVIDDLIKCHLDINSLVHYFLAFEEKFTKIGEFYCFGYLRLAGDFTLAKTTTSNEIFAIRDDGKTYPICKDEDRFVDVVVFLLLQQELRLLNKPLTESDSKLRLKLLVDMAGGNSYKYIYNMIFNMYPS